MWAQMALVAAIIQIASTPEKALKEADLCNTMLDFPCADRELRAARKQLDLLSQKDAIAVLQLSASVALSLGKRQEAEEHLLALLIRVPGFSPEPGAWQPEWLEVLEAARRRVPDKTPPQIKPEPIDSALPGASLVLRAKITDPSGVNRALLHLPQTKIEMLSTDGQNFTGIIPSEFVKPPNIEYRVEAWDAHGNRSTTSPLKTNIAPPTSQKQVQPSGAVTSKWWFWTALAVGVVGAAAGTTAIVLANQREPTTIIARIQWPQP